MSLDGLSLENASPKLLNKRNRVSPKRAFPKRKRKLRETPVLSEEEMQRAHRLLKAYLVSRKSHLERTRSDADAKLEATSIQGYLDYLRNYDRS
jgi:hypothetical protein